MKTIAFHSNQLSVRGTEVALYDYAHYNETLLGNRSVVLYDRLNPNNNPDALAKFNSRFEVLSYDHISQLDDVLAKGKADLMYAIKAGKRDGVVSKRIPTMVHAVFPTAPWQAHGSAYAYISEWLSRECSANEIPTVPHIVTMPDVSGDLRSELGIAPTALVLGCYGGANSYDVPCAISGAKRILEMRDDVYFIFLHLTPFLDHPRAIFLPGTTDMVRKTQFINTCDAMVHARLQGESFGLACGEFSVRNKPVITYANSKHKHHHWVLGESGFYYCDQDSLINIINKNVSINIKNKDWNVYSHLYNPERVMMLFDKNLIYKCVTGGVKADYSNISKSAYFAFIRLKLKMRSAHR